jgi:peptide/nickel transport system ATP-binding protein
MIVQNVRAYYAAGAGPEVRAVDDVSFSIHEGEVFGIVGESGCGKSTLASVMSLTPDSALKIKAGEIKLDSKALLLSEQIDVPQGWHGKMVALLPQRAMNSLNPTARMRNIIFDVMRAHNPKITRTEAIRRAQERLEQLGLPVRVLESYPHQLSGGMRQRVVAVVSTLLNPTVLIADEPTSALDVSSQKQLVQLLKQLLAEGVITRIAYITHDLPMLSNIANRIVVMYAGKIAEIGTTAEIIERPKHPYTQALIGSTLHLDLEMRERQVESISGAPPDLRCPPAGCRFHPRCSHVMDICSREEPPVIGDPDRFAACWWVQQQTQESNTEEIKQ